jgi:hypothetical protein
MAINVNVRKFVKFAFFGGKDGVECKGEGAPARAAAQRLAAALQCACSGSGDRGLHGMLLARRLLELTTVAVAAGGSGAAGGGGDAAAGRGGAAQDGVRAGLGSALMRRVVMEFLTAAC